MKSLLTEQLIISYLLSFITLMTMLMCLRWYRDYLQMPIAVSIALVLAAPACLQITSYRNSISFEIMAASLRGLAIGLPFALALEVLPFAGRLIDIARGMQFAEINLGITRNSILEGMLEFAVPLFFFKLDLHLILLKKYYQSCNVSSYSVSNPSEFFYSLIKLSSAGLKVGVEIAFPILVLCFAIELLALITSRFVGRVNLSSELAPAKSLLSLFALYLTIEIYPDLLLSLSNSLIR